MAKKSAKQKAVAAPKAEATEAPKPKEKSTEVDLSKLNRGVVETLVSYLNGRVSGEKAEQSVKSLLK